MHRRHRCDANSESDTMMPSSSSSSSSVGPVPDVNAVHSAMIKCTSSESHIRAPAEECLRRWESESPGTGYLISLLSIIERRGDGDVHHNHHAVRLMGAILLKNSISTAFAVHRRQREEGRADGRDKEEGARGEEEERNRVRCMLPNLLFDESIDESIALQLSLALAAISSFDFPHRWPTLLDDLATVASGTMPSSSSSSCGDFGTTTTTTTTISYAVRIRAMKTLRRCLKSIRLKKVVIGGGMGGGGRPIAAIINMADLGGMISRAANERKDAHCRASSIFDGLLVGIVGHARCAMGSGSIMGMDENAWRAESILAVGYVKCMTELLPMVNVDDRDVRKMSSVRDLMRVLADVFAATMRYHRDDAHPTTMTTTSQSSERTTRMDKLHRASLVCSTMSVRTIPRLFAPNVPGFLNSIVDSFVNLDPSALHSMPIKRLMDMTGFVRVLLTCRAYDGTKPDGVGGLGVGRNAILSALVGREKGSSNDEADDGGRRRDEDDPGILAARDAMSTLLAEGVIDRLCEALVGKFLRLYPEELEEWENDPEGRYESDLAERSILEANSPRHYGGALLLALLDRETDRVARSLLALTQRVVNNRHDDDAGGMLDREACYRALELCRVAMVGGGVRRLEFSEWFHSELGPMLRADLAEDAPVAMRAMQARAVQVVQAYSTSLKPEEFGIAFNAVARLIAARDHVTALCAARCINHLALIHVRGTAESAELSHVREHSVLALGNAFALANRSESEECLRVDLMCVSALVEANGLYLEPLLQAIAEQLPSLWERASDSVTIHSCLLSVLTHLIMKMGHATVENSYVQKVLFPLLDYCTDISVPIRADNLLEDGLRLWLVTLVSSRLATMGPALSNMLPRLEAILRSGLEPHLTLKVLQFNAILLGPEVVAPLSPILRDLLEKLTGCIYSDGDSEDAMDGDESSKGTDRGVTTIRNAIASFEFSEAILQLFPEMGVSICAPAIYKAVAAISGKKSMAAPVVESIFACLSRMLWANPNSFDEIFANDLNQDEKTSFVVNQFMAMVSSVSLVVLLSAQAQKIAFINQKRASLALCAAVCRSSRVARLAGRDVLDFTRKLIEVESVSKGLDLDTLVDTACGSTRKVVGDGPLGDAAARTTEILKSDPLLTVSLKEALESAERAVANV